MARDISISWILLAILAACALSGCCGATPRHRDWVDYYFDYDWRKMASQDSGVALH